MSYLRYRYCYNLETYLGQMLFRSIRFSTVLFCKILQQKQNLFEWFMISMYGWFFALCCKIIFVSFQTKNLAVCILREPFRVCSQDNEYIFEFANIQTEEAIHKKKTNKSLWNLSTSHQMISRQISCFAFLLRIIAVLEISRKICW